MRRRVFAAALMAFGLAATPLSPINQAATAADAPDNVSPPILVPPKLLDAPLGGKLALAAVKSKGLLASVAGRAGISEVEITRILETDRSASLDVTGQLNFTDPEPDPSVTARIAAEPRSLTPKLRGPEKEHDPGVFPDPTTLPKPVVGERPNPQVAPTTVQNVPAVAEGPFPYLDTFRLHSNPGATKVIFLDFDGHTTVAASNWGAFVGTPFDRDGNPATFSNGEQDMIQEIWQQIAEDFAPFDVDVTTQDPGFAAIDRFGITDANYGTRVAFVGNQTRTSICSTACGGKASIGAFDQTASHSFYQPAWGFTKDSDTGAAYSTKAIAELGSHEAGHTLGLTHDGCSANVGNCDTDTSKTGQAEYYAGHGNWAPIMGNSYNRPVTQWSRGEYLGANNSQDDLAVLASKIPYLPDETNNSIPTAKSMGLVTGPLVARGTISNPSDFDYFSFYAPTAGNATISLTPAPPSPNLDTHLIVYDAAGTILANVDPISTFGNGTTAAGMNATATVNLATTGYHYISVDSRQTDSTGDTGYSFYGSIGNYTVDVSLEQSGDSFWPVPASRLLDTRPTPIPSGSIREVTVAGVSGVPTSATAVVLNVAAVTPSGAGHLRVFPTGTPLPTASVLNFAAGQNTPNQVIVKVGAGRKVSIYAGNTTNVIVDISGYFDGDANHDQYTPLPSITPQPSITIPAAVVGNPAASTVNFTVLGVGGVPSTGPLAGISKVAVNIAARDPQSSGHLRVFPTGSPLPESSTNNFTANSTRTNLALVTPGVGGQISVYNASPGSVNVTVDSIGYFTWSGLGFKPVDPVRALDTRPLGAAPGSRVQSVQIRGVGSVPNSADVKAVVVNVAAVNPTQPGSICNQVVNCPTLFGGSQNGLYHPANQNVANLMILPIEADGTIRLSHTIGDFFAGTSGTSHMIVDITGYFTN
jgi:hypothetical protein